MRSSSLARRVSLICPFRFAERDHAIVASDLIRKRFHELRNESSRLQKQSAPPIVANNQVGGLPLHAEMLAIHNHIAGRD